MKEKIISENEFYKNFNLVKNHIDKNAAFDNCMFETFGKELEYVKEMVKTNPLRVWTILDCGGEGLAYISGFHFINRLGYLITKEEFNKDECITVDLKQE